MANFKQTNQTVQHQYNAETINQYSAQTIEFGNATNREEFLRELKKLQNSICKAIETKQLTGENSIDAESYLKKSILQAEKKAPNKTTIIEHLTKAKEYVTSVNSLATAVNKMVELAESIF